MSILIVKTSNIPMLHKLSFFIHNEILKKVKPSIRIQYYNIIN